MEWNEDEMRKDILKLPKNSFLISGPAVLVLVTSLFPSVVLALS